MVALLVCWHRYALGTAAITAKSSDVEGVDFSLADFCSTLTGKNTVLTSRETKKGRPMGDPSLS
ncbi:hypothetical protein [Tateyamaria omphalii]|uniref:hypothetical protein n=1 Tax=Tateyamaria omphalii TaxID=299262 RepID=UPI0012FB8258|nr:hypothetical protein [Tateyamaria omphalii]